MELGNMLYGNSRGEYPIERGEGWEQQIKRLIKAYEPYSNDDCDPPRFENDTFFITPYYWGDCACGFEDLEWEWSESHKHADDCYQTRLRNEVAAFNKTVGYEQPQSLSDAFFVDSEPILIDGRAVGESVVMTPRRDDAEAYRKHSTFEEQARQHLCAELGLTFPEGSAVHCTCTHDAEYVKWREVNDHLSTCPLVIPNFRYKLTGFEINWYKYPLRDSYKNQNISLDTFREIIDVCVASLNGSNGQRDLSQ